MPVSSLRMRPMLLLALQFLLNTILVLHAVVSAAIAGSSTVTALLNAALINATAARSMTFTNDASAGCDAVSLAAAPTSLLLLPTFVKKLDPLFVKVSRIKSHGSDVRTNVWCGARSNRAATLLLLLHWTMLLRYVH